jgi:hypothetical protein
MKMYAVEGQGEKHACVSERVSVENSFISSDQTMEARTKPLESLMLLLLLQKNKYVDIHHTTHAPSLNKIPAR